SSSVGRWRLATEVSQTQVNLGEPLTVKVILEGKGNLKNLAMPPLGAPPALKVYDPTTTDKVTTTRSFLGGRRVQEYLVMAQQTGTFTLPGLAFEYFDPETGSYQTSRTDPVSITVLPGAGGATAISTGPRGNPLEDPAHKNKLEAGGLRPLRYQAHFAAPSPPLWVRPFFLPLALGAPAALLGAVLFGLLRGALSGEDAASKKKKQARAARARLAAAEKLKATGRPDQFYGEVEKALLGFLEAKLGTPVAGLTRERLAEALAAAGVAEERRRRTLAALENCEAGRYSPGGGGAARGLALDEAAAAMEGWDGR
ncbi:MAG: BatD family protein, partial [Myxococcaceae bacterium]